MGMEDLKDAVVEWAKAIGENQAIARLIFRDVGVRTASRLCKGQYDSTPRGMLANILREEIKKDGITVPAKNSEAV